jgi:hypothetical protein
VVGLILHARGTLRIFRNDRDRLYVEVIGFDSHEGRRFLEQLGGQLEDITAEVLVHEHPDLYGAPFGEPARLHRRREVGAAGGVTGTVAPPARPAP